MKKFSFAKEDDSFVKNPKENTLNMINTLLDIVQLKLIIKLLELLDK